VSVPDVRLGVERRWLLSTEPHWPDHLLTLGDWNALPEDHTRQYELMEGVLIVTPKPILPHQSAGWRLAGQLEPQLPLELSVVTDSELVVDPGSPATVRVPDVMIVPTAAVDDGLARVDADAVPLAVEILSPGSRRTDQVTKFAEYAEAGIAYYWIIDLDKPVSLLAYHLIDGEYELVGEHSGRATIDLFGASIEIDLPALTGRR
jgi:Uma2 family endonuclease